MRNHNVNEAVWLAAAIMTFKKILNNPFATREDIYFRQADIVHKAQEFTDNKVDAARVSWWFNADNENATQNYLRADSKDNPSLRRLSMLNEFSDKTYPKSLDDSEEVMVDGESYQIFAIMDYLMKNILMY